MISLRNHLQSPYLGSLGEEVGQCRFPLKTLFLSSMSPIGDYFLFLSLNGFQEQIASLVWLAEEFLFLFFAVERARFLGRSPTGLVRPLP
jgi:hypothetical protein